ncbi:dynamin family protein [Pseudobutyrivibrio xylanivorans]|uniref:Dynamin family protein n=1 Tax=Pseudobutyrivibrio xylanivorans TaxID=185007 RepID=A0A5P6VL95_PSEXY|nr:dynamin family protein [Pseudobutyrivibrio xylanivorans]QFJ53436.1 Dynamin family protein [Pseudobutyrivibrio xylanivorans]
MNFKSLREDKLHLSQEEMAQITGVSITQIQEWDENNQLSMEAIQAIASKTALDFNTILGYEKPTPKAFEATDTWKKTDFTKKTLVEFFESSLENYDISEEYRKKYIDDLAQSVKNTLVKPSIAIVGRSDTGKSTLINSLLGTEKMPTSWTPTTSIAVYIKHINDRPTFITDDAWVFTDHIGDEQLWDVKKLYDEDYCKKWLIAGGHVDILRDFGTRQGCNYSQRVGAAVLFLDAPILKNCDIVDLPGFGTETESDDLITMKAAQSADLLIYLSQANGFMRIEDITYLKENVRNLPVWESKEKNELKPLSNLFVVASQAHTVNNGNREQLQMILKTGCENFSKTLGIGYWDSRIEESGYKEDYSNIFLPTRFFTYTTDIPDLCKNFDEELKIITETLPLLIENKTKDIVKNYISCRKPNLEAEIKHYEDICNEREKYVTLLNQIDENELNRIQETNANKKEILDYINSLSIDSRNEFSSYCASTINTDAIAEMIKKKGIKNKKDDIDIFASQLQDTLSEKCNEIIRAKADLLSVETKKFVSQFNEGIAVAFEKSNVKADFDAGFAFVSALSKLGIVGGLGAYLAGEAAFWFGSISFIAGLGGDLALGGLALGPIGVFLGLAIAGVLGIVKLFGGGWEKSVAKKIVNAYEDNNVINNYRDSMNEYWRNTEDAFRSAAEKLDEEWSKYVDTLRETVNTYDVNEINENITILKNIESFFGNIPL